MDAGLLTLSGAGPAAGPPVQLHGSRARPQMPESRRGFDNTMVSNSW